jgi:hypothetical protein
MYVDSCGRVAYSYPIRGIRSRYLCLGSFYSFFSSSLSRLAESCHAMFEYSSKKHPILRMIFIRLLIDTTKKTTRRHDGTIGSLINPTGASIRMTVSRWISSL